MTFIYKLVLTNRRQDELIITMLKGAHFNIDKKKSLTLEITDIH